MPTRSTEPVCRRAQHSTPLVAYRRGKEQPHQPEVRPPVHLRRRWDTATMRPSAATTPAHHRFPAQLFDRFEAEDHPGHFLLAGRRNPVATKRSLPPRRAQSPQSSLGFRDPTRARSCTSALAAPPDRRLCHHLNGPPREGSTGIPLGSSKLIHFSTQPRDLDIMMLNGGLRTVPLPAHHQPHHDAHTDGARQQGQQRQRLHFRHLHVGPAPTVLCSIVCFPRQQMRLSSRDKPTSRHSEDQRGCPG